MGHRAFKRVTAFTIIELLVVLGIVLILLAILIPLLKSARESARLTACATQLSQIGRGNAAYAVDWRGYIPPAADPSQSSGVIIWQGWKPKRGYKLYGVLLDGDYIGDRGELFLCPNSSRDEKDFFTSSGRPRWGWYGGALASDYAQKAVSRGVPKKLTDAATTTLMLDIISRDFNNHGLWMNLLKGSGAVERFDWGSRSPAE